jgi:cell wall assembly regulator SMI1/predicted DNA-binding WGR domain protein
MVEAPGKSDVKALDGEQRQKLDGIRNAVVEEEPKLAAAVGEYNATVKAAYEKLRGLIGGYNRAQGELDHFRCEIVDAMTDYVFESPYEWQESEEGQGYQAWIDAWHEASIFPLDFKQPPELTTSEPPLSAIIAALPCDPGEVEMSSDEPKDPKPTADRPIDPKTAASVKASWKRIDGWLTQHAPPLMAKMGKGATSESIARAEAILGVELPDDVRASYAVHDGSGGQTLFPSGEYLSLDGILDQYRCWKELVEEGTLLSGVTSPKGPIRNDDYNLKWIPLTHNCGDHTLIDLAPAEGGKVGQLIDLSHETGPEGVAAPNLAEYLSALADALESGAGPFNGEYIDWRRERGMARSAFSPAPKESGAETTAKRYFESTEGTSNKFWEAYHQGSEMTTRYGKIGTDGRSTTKSYANPEKAAAETAKIIANKIKEGYVEKTP